EQLYTEVHILPYLTQQRWLEVSEFSNFEVNQQPLRLNEPVTHSKPALAIAATQSRLMLLGKPGAGKTTFLHHLALQCARDRFRADCIPVVVSLRTVVPEATEPAAIDLAAHLELCWVKDGLPAHTLKPLLDSGKILVLLDGLDEVGTDALPSLRDALQRFADEYYQLPMVITSRLGVASFTLPGFHYAEVADLTQSQVEAFVSQYFAATTPAPQGPQLARQFLEQLKHPDNSALRELVATPILLHLLCRIFQDRKTFPTKRAKLYQVGLEILVSRWDQVRGIQRNLATETWSVTDKLKVLSHIAAHFFEQEQYFFDKTQVVQVIAQYLQSEGMGPSDTEQLRFASEEILKILEVEHGLLVQRAYNVYSFSHLTFQEYLTARKIAATPEPLLPARLKVLAQYVDTPRWREVIGMTCGALIQPYLLLNLLLQTIERTVQDKASVQTLLAQVHRKAQHIKVDIDAAALRAFYLALSQNLDWGLAIALDSRIARSLPHALEFDLALARLYHQCGRLDAEADYRSILHLYFALNIKPKHDVPESFETAWQACLAQLPPLDTGKEALLAWWHARGPDWCNQLRKQIVLHCFGSPLLFSDTLRVQVAAYYNALRFFVTCLQEATLSLDQREQLLSQLIQPLNLARKDHLSHGSLLSASDFMLSVS
ncbi:MAG TPA: NACHT domain-containing protein, partial [Stenomitos sp.]